jgi:hypothetical protein
MLIKSVFTIVFLLVTLAIIIPTGADQSPIIYNPTTQQETNKTTDSKENPQTQNQNSTPPLTIVNSTPPPPLQEIRENESSQYGKEQKSSWWGFSLTDALLAIFTCGLVIVGWLQVHILRNTLKVTNGLLTVSQEQSRDMKTYLTIANDAAISAQKSANSAKKSADALQAIDRARLFIKVAPDPPRKEPITGVEVGYNQVRIIIINEGKSLAIITKFNCHIGVMNGKEIDDKFSELISKPTDTPENVITISRNSTKNIPLMCEINYTDFNKIDYSTTYFVCLGHIRYKDVFRNVRTIVFCWKDNGVYFSPDPDPKRNDYT